MKMQNLTRLVFGTLLLSSSINLYAAPVQVSLDLNAGDGSAQSAVGERVKDLISALQAEPSLDTNATELLSALQLIDANSDTPDSLRALSLISPQNNSSNTSFIKKFPSFNHLQGLGKRLSAFRKGNSFAQRGFRFNGIALPIDNLVSQILKNAGVKNIESGGLLDNQISGFLTGDYVYARQNQTATEAGFSGNIGRIVAGADYRINTHLFAGLYGSMFFGSLDLDGNLGDLSANEQRLAAYATYYPFQNVYIDLAVGGARRQFTLTRQIDFTIADTTFDQIAKSSPGGNNLEGKIGLGMDIPVIGSGIFSANTGLTYGVSKINGFQEKNGGGFNLAIDEQNIKNIMATLGSQFVMTVSTSVAVFSPFVGLNFTHEFADGGDVIQAHFVSDPSETSFSYIVDDADANYIDVTLGSSAIFAGGISAFAQVNSLFLFENFKRISVTAGARKEF